MVYSLLNWLKSFFTLHHNRTKSMRKCLICNGRFHLNVYHYTIHWVRRFVYLNVSIWAEIILWCVCVCCEQKSVVKIVRTTKVPWYGWIIITKFTRYLWSMPHSPGHQAFRYQLISNNISFSFSLFLSPYSMCKRCNQLLWHIDDVWKRD